MLLRAHRYMYLHNYTMSVPQLISQINRPAEKADYLESLATYSTTNQGNEENYIDYLKFGAGLNPKTLNLRHNPLSELLRIYQLRSAVDVAC